MESTVRYASASGRWLIAATVLGSGMAALDATVVGIALPSIGREFRADVAGLQWVVTGYMLSLAGLLLLGGSLGDRFGRRRVFLIGVVWFAAASLLCGLAPSAGALIGARILQGVGGALLTPGSLAILEASFAPDDRARAIGAWSGLGGLATALGPFVGGYLIGAFSWRLIFLVNLPVAVAVVLVSLRHVPESHDPSMGGRVDVLGAVLATAGLVGVCFGLIEGSDLGWTSPPILGSLAAGLLCLVLFVVAQARTPQPMLPLDIFRSTQFTAANLVTLVVYGALGGAFFLLPIELIQVGDYRPIQAGAALLPVTAIMLLFSARAGALASRIGPRFPMTMGPLVAGAGLALLARVGQSPSYLLDVLPAIVVFGAGLTLTVAPLTATVLAAAPAEHAGIASAVNNDVARTAGLLAVAILPAAAGLTGASYLHPEQFAAGFREAMLMAAVVCALGGVLAAMTIRNPTRAKEQPELVAPETHCALDGPPLRGRHHHDHIHAGTIHGEVTAT